MIAIPLRRRGGLVHAHALIDDCDAHLAEFRWYLGSEGYVRRSHRGATILLARSVLGLTPGDGLQGDHVNGDPLDNRRVNLRIVTCAENQQNRRSVHGSSSRFRGVTWNKKSSKWQAGGTLHGVSYYLGVFEREEDAAQAAAAWRAEHMTHSPERAVA